MAKKTDKKTTNTVATIAGARVVPAMVCGLKAPTLVFDGDTPEVGQTVRAKLANGITYTGTVASAKEAEGRVTVTFTHGLTPQK